MRDDFSEIKRSFNALVMGAYDELKARVEAADDPLRAAIQLSMAGNYIDFGVLRDVDSAGTFAASGRGRGAKGGRGGVCAALLRISPRPGLN